MYGLLMPSPMDRMDLKMITCCLEGGDGWGDCRCIHMSEQGANRIMWF